MVLSDHPLDGNCSELPLSSLRGKGFGRALLAEKRLLSALALLTMLGTGLCGGGSFMYDLTDEAWFVDASSGLKGVESLPAWGPVLLHIARNLGFAFLLTASSDTVRTLGVGIRAMSTLPQMLIFL